MFPAFGSTAPVG